MTATVTTDFREEFEAESARWLRVRFIWYCAVTLIISAVSMVFLGFLLVIAPPEVRLESFIVAGVSLAAFAAYVWLLLFAYRRRSIRRELLIRIVYWLIVLASLANLGATPLTNNIVHAISEAQQTQLAEEPSLAEDKAKLKAPTEQPVQQDDEDPLTLEERDVADDVEAQAIVREPQLGVGVTWMLNLFFAHFFAALFIPWTPREAIAPLIPLLALNAVLALSLKLLNNSDTWLDTILAITLSPLVGVPGTLICWWRHSSYRKKFHYRMLRGRYGEIKQELTDARRIHEALFPAPISDGPVRMDYIYEPMRQIGGDYFFTRHTLRDDGSAVLNLILIDVTGHGLTAALTVNRLAGEIQREFGENPVTSPADILRGLNNYIHHTLALHSVYATALALRVDTKEDRLTWASAGHPPAFLRAVNGNIERLESTALVLGACLGDDFVVEEDSHTFGRGDTVLLYTDGATEARNEEGKMLTVRGLEAILANGRPEARGGWTSTVMQYVEQHREGAADDDTLLVEVYRPLNT